MAEIRSIRINNFAAYGLNRNRNFLDNEGPEYMKGEKQVRLYCIEKLAEHPCMESAIFCCFHNGKYMAVIKQVDPECITEDFDIMHDEVLPTFLVVPPTRDKDCIQEVDGEFRLCCYGLIIEREPGIWEVQE